jgi:PmbA protein
MGIGLVRSNSTASEGITASVNYAKRIAELNLEPKYDLVGKSGSYPKVETTEKSILNDPVGSLEKFSEEIKDILKGDASVQPTFGKFRIYSTNKMLENCEGLLLEEPSTKFYYEFAIKAENEGKLAEYWPKNYCKHSSQLKLDENYQNWGKFAKDMLRAIEPKSEKEIEVIFSPFIVNTAIGDTLGYSSTAKAYFEKMSKLMLNESVASENFTMMDDGLLDNGLRTSSWDGEGNPKQTNMIIEKGTMKNYLFDQKYAKLLNEKSTGNSARILQAGGNTTIGINNLVIKPGSLSKDELISSMKHGIFIEEFSWLNPDAITGIFGAEIRTAYMVENGVIGQPIKGGNLSGNVYEMVKNISGISREREHIGNSLVPWMKFKNLTLTGN